MKNVICYVVLVMTVELVVLMAILMLTWVLVLGTNFSKQSLIIMSVREDQIISPNIDAKDCSSFPSFEPGMVLFIKALLSS